MEQKNKAPVNWVLRAAGVLLCLVLASTYLVCGMFARYTTSASGSDSARVAKFSISGTAIQSADITADLSPGEEKTCEMEINNDSEVAVEFEVSIKNLTNNLPLDFSVRLQEDGGGEDDLDEVHSFVFTDQMNPGEKTIYKLYILWPGDASSPQYSGMVDQIRVTVNATQID